MSTERAVGFQLFEFYGYLCYKVDRQGYNDAPVTSSLCYIARVPLIQLIYLVGGRKSQRGVTLCPAI